MPSHIPQWNTIMISLRAGGKQASFSMASPQEAVKNIKSAYKQHNSALKRFGHVLAFKRRAVGIAKLNPVGL
jgi:hypothetical protein